MQGGRANRLDETALSRRFPRSSPVQALTLVLLTIVAYYHAFFDVARADQLIYLHRTAGMDLWALTVGSYNLNRSVGDVRLFRPMLYMVLGVERWAWGYHFVLWQATSIGLHIGIVLSLFAYFRQRLAGLLPPAQPSATPFVLALFFALLFAGTEMVAWHHVVGYLLFCLLSIQGALAYQRLVTRPAPRHGIVLVACAGLACFTYELGNVLAVVFAVMLLCLQGGRRSQPARSGGGVLLATAVMLLAAPCGYALWSWLDYQRVPTPSTSVPTVDIGRLIGGAVISAGSWLLASLWPAGLQLVPGSRIQAARPFPLRSVLAALNIVVSLIAATAVVPLALRRGRDLATDWLPAAAFLLLAAVYTAIIVLGRSLERGIIPTLLDNSYYAYIFALFCLLACFHLALVPAEAARDASGLRRRRVLLVSLTAIALLGGARIFALHAAMHREYSGPIGMVLERIEALQSRHAAEPDFSFGLAADCPALLEIPWFAPYASEKLPRYTVATALFPDSARGEGGKYTVECR
jgi:hypothetical protein